jgi:hypothetical protein
MQNLDTIASKEHTGTNFYLGAGGAAAQLAPPALGGPKLPFIIYLKHKILLIFC